MDIQPRKIGRPKGSKNGERKLYCITCAFCFSKFSVEHWQINSRRYCNKSCYSKAQEGQPRPESHKKKLKEGWANGTIKLSPEGLAKIIETSSRPKSKTAIENNIKARLLANGTGDYINPKNGSLQLRLWIKAVRERDCYTCQHCHITEDEWKNKQKNLGYRLIRSLDVHHIKDWDNFPELRYDIDNGLTLCHPCHSKEEAKLKEGKITEKRQISSY